MRIRLLQALSGVMKHYEAGREVEWEDADALRLISRGAAERIDDIPEAKAPIRRGKKAAA
ncbi:hypothetical protein [Rhizobium mayense]|uniref:hypothetical protein n=1 Tax=Rhizobium mayense TaxID=1312184 RepID=UPI00398C365E